MAYSRLSGRAKRRTGTYQAQRRTASALITQQQMRMIYKGAALGTSTGKAANPVSLFSSLRQQMTTATVIAEETSVPLKLLVGWARPDPPHTFPPVWHESYG